MPPRIVTLIDRRQACLFNALAQPGWLRQPFEASRGPGGLVWARRERSVFTLGWTWLESAELFDDFLTRHAPEIVQSFNARLRRHTEQSQRRAIEQMQHQLRTGSQAERLLWLIHEQVVGQGCSVLYIPDAVIRNALWAPPNEQPKHWRTTVRQVLGSLAKLHVTDASPSPEFGAASALIHNAVDLRGSHDDQCIPTCPMWRRGPHSHFMINLGRGFLGILEQLNSTEEEGVRYYDFDDLRSLRRIAREYGRIVRAFHPIIYADDQRLSVDRRRLFSTLFAEGTRASGRRPERQLFEITDALVPDLAGRGRVQCPLLRPGIQYVCFGGNGRRRGMGYKLMTWLAKAGYREGRVGTFVNDLAVLAELLGLTVVGLVRRGRLHWLTLPRLRTTTRDLLDDVHLRIYAPADYQDRWMRTLGWPPLEEDSHDSDSKLSILHSRLGRRGAITQLAASLGTTRPRLSKLLAGRLRWRLGELDRAVAALNEVDGQ